MQENQKVMNNFAWRFLERCGAQGVSFVVSIVLARLLAPEAYGTIALVTVFTSLLQVFIGSGLGTALIQKKDADDLDFSTVFFFNSGLCIVLYAILFFTAPYISGFYQMPELTPVTRVLGLTLLISTIKGIQHSYVAKKMIFKRFFFATLGGTLGAAVVGIYMAYKGYGVWALVAQSLFNNLIDTLVLWFTVKWRPKWMYSWRRLKGLFAYGWKILVSALLDTGYRELRQLIIGKVYTAGDLAYYNKGNQFPNLIIDNINSSINSVLLPAMAAEQDNVARVRGMTRRAIKISTFIIMPMMMGLAVCAEPLIRLLLTEKWLPCVLFLRIYCFSYAFYPIHTANLSAIKALGRSDLFLGMEILKKAIGLIAVVATMFISVEAMAYSMLATTVLSQIINAWPNKKLLGYSYFEQVKDMLPQILLSCAMGAVVYCVSFFPLPDIVLLVIQVVTGVVVYTTGSALLRLESFNYILATIKNKTKK